MYILIDHRIPSEAKTNLAFYGQFIELKTNEITYDAISSHPDIFCCQTPDNLIIAPNIPLYIVKTFQEKNIKFIFGNKSIGKQYPRTSHYNAVVTDKFLIHNTKNTDKKIVEICSDKKNLSVNQGYTCCNLIALNENNYITSDKGIYMQLQSNKYFKVLYVNPDKILLTGVNNGFFGGCCGIYQNKLFIIGNLDYLAEGLAIKEFIAKLGLQIVELYDGPLFDGGSILFFDC